MSLVERKVRKIRWRLEWINFCRRFVRLVLIALFLFTAYIIVTKFVEPRWLLVNVATVIVGVTIPLALLWAFFTRTSVRQAAIATDKKMSLRERLSTALILGAPRDRMEVAVAADAEVHAKPLRAHQVFPMPVWRDFYFMPIPVVFTVLVASFLPNYWEIAEEKKRKAETMLPTQAQNKLARRIEVFQRDLDKMAKNLPPVKVNQLSADMQELLRDLRKHQMSRSDVYKRIAKMADKVAERKGELDKRMEAASQLQKFQKADLTKDMVDAMSKGDFSQAKKELDELKGKLEAGSLTDQQRKKLSAELKGLGEALKNMPEMSKALQQAAQQMQAGDLQNALAQLNLTANELQALADTLQQMAELDQLQMAMQAMRGMQGLGDDLSSGSQGMMSYEAMLREMGLFREGDTSREGAGMGGPGRGMGGIPKFEDTPTAFKPYKTRMKMDKGDIIGVIKVWGPQVKGEATEKFTEVFIDSRQMAEETLNKENIPLEYRVLVKDWFDAIRPATMATQPPRPTPDSGDAGQP